MANGRVVLEESIRFMILLKVWFKPPEIALNTCMFTQSSSRVYHSSTCSKCGLTSISNICVYHWWFNHLPPRLADHHAANHRLGCKCEICHWLFYSRRSAAGSARTKVTRCHKRKCRCRSRSNILRQIHPKTLYLAPFLCL